MDEILLKFLKFVYSLIIVCHLDTFVYGHRQTSLKGCTSRRMSVANPLMCYLSDNAFFSCGIFPWYGFVIDFQDTLDTVPLSTTTCFPHPLGLGPVSENLRSIYEKTVTLGRSIYRNIFFWFSFVTMVEIIRFCDRQFRYLRNITALRFVMLGARNIIVRNLFLIMQEMIC